MEGNHSIWISIKMEKEMILFEYYLYSNYLEDVAFLCFALFSYVTFHIENVALLSK